MRQKSTASAVALTDKISLDYLVSRNIKLLVCDMAGTTVDEHGLVYSTLRACMNDAGLNVTEEEMHPWHGAQKTEVVAHFLQDRGTSNWEAEAKKIDNQFEERIQVAYFSDDSPVKLIHSDLPDFCANLKANGIKMALNTGYPTKIQQGLIKHLDLSNLVDGAICASDVGAGRPMPYMIHGLMKELGIEDVRTVAKAGDTIRDIEEGLNAGVGLNIGVLSGADGEKELLNAGADVIVENIVDFNN